MEAQELEKLEVELHLYDTEWDEFWSYVGSKSNQRWTWYLIERQSGVIIAWQNGRRKDKILQRLLDSVAHIPIKTCHTDDWAAYSRLFPSRYLHLIGKDKEASRKLAIQWFPKAPLQLKGHHGRAEALLIARWGMQHGAT